MFAFICMSKALVKAGSSLYGNLFLSYSVKVLRYWNCSLLKATQFDFSGSPVTIPITVATLLSIGGMGMTTSLFYPTTPSKCLSSACFFFYSTGSTCFFPFLIFGFAYPSAFAISSSLFLISTA